MLAAALVVDMVFDHFKQRRVAITICFFRHFEQSANLFPA
jgi:hypothetical protein